MRRQSSPVRLGQIGGHHPDLGEPYRIGVGAPTPQISGTVAGCHVDHRPPLDVDQSGHVAGRLAGSGRLERRLVDTELGHGADPVGVIGERGAVLDHRVHDRPPTHPKLAGHRGDRPGLLTDLPARLGARPAGQHRCRVELVDVFGPRPLRAQRFAAPPPAAPHIEAHGTPETRQVTHRTRRAVLSLSTHPTRRAPPHRRRRLNPHDELAVALGHVEHPHAGQAQQHLHHRDTVVHARGSFQLQSSRNRNTDRTPGPKRGSPCPHAHPRSL